MENNNDNSENSDNKLTNSLFEEELSFLFVETEVLSLEFFQNFFHAKNNF